MVWNEQYSINDDISGKALLEHQLKQEIVDNITTAVVTDVRRLGDAFWVDCDQEPSSADKTEINSCVTNHVPT